MTLCPINPWVSNNPEVIDKLALAALHGKLPLFFPFISLIGKNFGKLLIFFSWRGLRCDCPAADSIGKWGFATRLPTRKMNAETVR
jgi:hypothetical protein